MHNAPYPRSHATKAARSQGTVSVSRVSSTARDGCNYPIVLVDVLSGVGSRPDIDGKRFARRLDLAKIA